MNRDEAMETVYDFGDWEVDNLLTNLLMICGKQRLTEAMNAPTGEASLLILSGKEFE